MLVSQSCPTLCNPMDLSMEVFRQENWNGLPFPSPGDLPNPGIELMSPAQVDGLFITEPPKRTLSMIQSHTYSNPLSLIFSYSPTLYSVADSQVSLSLPFCHYLNGVGCHSIFQGVVLTKGLNPGLPHCRHLLYHLSHLGFIK